MDDASEASEMLLPLPSSAGVPDSEAADDPTPGDAESGAGATVAGAPFALFMDPATGFSTDAVHDADREIVRFDTEAGALVSDASGDAVSGWSVTSNDLRWSGFGVSFRVRFGTEAGERRAYFTEAGPGTICDLRLAGPNLLSISGTSERPPNP
jgi:hypothetical protein